MLPAVALAGADGGADDERHLGLGTRHVMPLAGLVRDLVGGHEREVHVHELDDGPQPNHGGTDRRAANAGLRDRRVEDTLAAERLQQVLGELEGPAIVRDVLAVNDDSTVAQHLLDERLTQGVLVRHRAVGALADRRIGVGNDRAFGIGDDIGGGVRVEVLEQVGRIRVRRLRGSDGGSGVALVSPRFDPRESGRVGDAGRDQLGLEPIDRVDGPPGRFLFLGPVLVTRVRERVAVVAVRARLDQDRALALAADLGGPIDRLANGQHVHAVDRLGVHVVLGESGGAAGQVVDAHHFLVGPMGHAVVVVDDQVDDRQAGRSGPGKVVGPLLLRRPVERLEDDAVGIRAVAGEAAHDLVGATVAERHRRARGDRTLPPTMAFAPRCPVAKSPMCIPPPRPWQ